MSPESKDLLFLLGCSVSGEKWGGIYFIGAFLFVFLFCQSAAFTARIWYYISNSWIIMWSSIFLVIYWTIVRKHSSNLIIRAEFWTKKQLTDVIFQPRQGKTAMTAWLLQTRKEAAAAHWGSGHYCGCLAYQKSTVAAHSSYDSTKTEEIINVFHKVTSELVSPPFWWCFVLLGWTKKNKSEKSKYLSDQNSERTTKVHCHAENTQVAPEVKGESTHRSYMTVL